MNPVFEFSSELWPWTEGKGASWIFLTVPEDESDQIKNIVPHVNGFGSVRVNVTVGENSWATSLFPSKELGCYVLPFKKAIRKAEKVDEGDTVDVSIEVLLD